MEGSPSTTPKDRNLKVKRWVKRIPALLVLGFLSYRYLRMQIIKSPKQINVEALGLSQLDRSPIPLPLIHGRAIVLNFWAPWCPPCRIETPWLEKLQTEHPKDLLVVGVVADSEQYSEARDFMAERGGTYPLVRETASIEDAFGKIIGLPTTYYISSSGKVVHSVSGLIPQPLMNRYANDAMHE